jgi:hypothetical protein
MPTLIRSLEAALAIEIKGFGDAMEAARAAIRKSRAATARVKDAGTELATTADDIASTLEQHTSDLLREATQLGNEPAPSVTPKVDTAKATEVKEPLPFPVIAPGVARNA